MGIISRQGTKATIVNYLGAAIAAVSVLFIYVQDKSIYGYAQFLYSAAYFLVPLASLGVTALAVKFFPRFRDRASRHNGFLPLLLTWAAAGFLLFVGFGFVLKEPFLDFLSFLRMDAPRIQANLGVITALSAVLVLVILFTQYISNFHRIVVPAVLKDLGFKVFLPLIFLCTLWGWIGMKTMGWALVLFFVGVAIALGIYLVRLKQWSLKANWSFWKPALRKEMRSYATYGALNQIGSGLAFRIDAIMIPIMMSLASNGIYNILLVIANVIEIPTRAIRQIAAPIVSKAWESGDTEEIRSVYKKTSLTLLVIGIYLFLLLWFVFEGLFELSSRGQEILAFKYVFLFLAVGKLVDMATGVNTHVIGFSSAYRYNLFFLLLLGGTNVLLNYLLISNYGLIGAAIATATSMCLFNALKFAFIWFRFRMMPFGRDTLVVLGVALVCFFVLSSIHLSTMPLLRIGLFAVLLTALYIPAIYILKVSPDINALIRQTWRRFF